MSVLPESWILLDELYGAICCICVFIFFFSRKLQYCFALKLQKCFVDLISISIGREDDDWIHFFGNCSIVSILQLVTETYPSQTRTTAAPRVKQTHILSFEENAEALVHRRLVLGSVGLAFLQRLDGAELSCEPLEQGLLNMERLEHSFVDRPQLPVDLNLRERKHSLNSTF